ncbi:MAG: hypothetical protein ACLGID_00380 [Gammaproteobacteria bacterium]
MSIRQIEQSLHEAIDAGESETLELYAEHCAESLNELGESLCLAVIGMGHPAWLAVMAVASQRAPKLADALESIEEHISRQRASFIEARALNISDAAEHDAMCRAELNSELRRAS